MSVRTEYAERLVEVLPETFAVVPYPGTIQTFGPTIQWVVTLASTEVVPRDMRVGKLTETLLAALSYNGEWKADREEVLEQGRDLFIESARDTSGAWWTKAERRVIDGKQAWSFDLTAHSIIDTESE